MGTENKKGMDFDSSLLSNFDKTLTEEEYISKLTTDLNNILIRKFPNNPIKQQVRVHNDRITIACPYCGDSVHDIYKKRGNLILKGKFAGFYKCFNCETFKKIDKFLEDFGINVDIDTINYLSSSTGDFKTASYGKYDISILIDNETIDGYAIDRSEIKARLGLIEVSTSPILPWLHKRLQYEEERFLYNPKHNYLVILNLTKDKKVLGFQIRPFKLKPGQSKYKTYTLSKIYEILKINKQVPSELDVLSQIYKISEINFNRPIILFEGPLDAFLCKNAIANAGATKSLPIELPIRYWYDEDSKGTEKSIEKLNQGEYVFLWKKFRNEFEIPWRKKWDLNDILLWFKQNNKKFPWATIDIYFSNDPFDLLDL